MKELKFRVWSEEDKEYRTDCRLTELFTSETGTPATVYNDEGDRFIIEQYTGLKDKNGKEIYEGDIVKSKKRQRDGFVEYMDNDGAFIIWWTSENEFIYLGEAIRKYEDLEVIGNIHEDKLVRLIGGNNERQTTTTRKKSKTS